MASPKYNPGLETNQATGGSGKEDTKDPDVTAGLSNDFKSQLHIDPKPNGTFKTELKEYTLPGCFNAGGTHKIICEFPAENCQGRKQNKTTHVAYVQNTEIGRVVVKLMEKAFHAGVLFKLRTGGRVTWNGIKVLTDNRKETWRGYLPDVIEDLKGLGITLK